jgi:thiosulfate dehydrogenase [quinone] large subunit
MYLQNNDNSLLTAGSITTALRWVVGWTYFSAFWRRLFLADKLNPEAAGYIGEKFNHFLPNALGIGPLIEYMVENPELLWWAMTIFTIVEGIVGLLMILGLFTRAMSVGVFGLAMGILLGSGWIGTTCLDEWQIGVLGIATGFILFLSGSGKYSIDYWLMKKNHSITKNQLFKWIGSGPLPFSGSILSKVTLVGSIFMIFTTLFTNQYFHGGVWGELHNKSVSPELEITNASIKDNQLQFDLYRTQGVDVYGSFLIGLELQNENGEKVLDLDGEELSTFPKANISNKYVAQVKPHKHSLLIPLGAKATMKMDLPKITNGTYTSTLTDISGKSWSILTN